jgi:hypothetical protein
MRGPHAPTAQRHAPPMQGAIFQTYLALVGATVSAVAKDAALQHYLALSRELQVRLMLGAPASSCPTRRCSLAPRARHFLAPPPVGRLRAHAAPALPGKGTAAEGRGARPGIPAPS